MSLARVALAWAAVALWFSLWATTKQRLQAGPRRPGMGGARGWVQAALLPGLTEALLLTLLAALWFGSLGHGGWVLLFGLLGLLLEVPARLRTRTAMRWRPVIGGVIRILVAGGLTDWLLS